MKTFGDYVQIHHAKRMNEAGVGVVLATIDHIFFANAIYVDTQCVLKLRKSAVEDYFYYHLPDNFAYYFQMEQLKECIVSADVFKSFSKKLQKSKLYDYMMYYNGTIADRVTTESES
jgi:hypothetical protein